MSTTKTNGTEVFAQTEATSVPTRVSTLIDMDERGLILFNNYISPVLLAVLSPAGVATNIMNIIIYWNQGIKDNVNITFLTLSFWDFMHCFLLFLTEICLVLTIYFPQATVFVNPMTFQFVFLAHTRGCMYILSTLVTVYLSIERSICITLPFKVKDIFTTHRVVLVNFLILVIGLASFSPAWATQGLHWSTDAKTNTTRLHLWLSNNRRDIDLFVDTFNGIVIPALAQVLISISGWFMIQGIKKSNKFRQRETNIWKPRNTFNLNDQKHSTLNCQFSFTQRKTSNKDVKLTKVVISLATIFFACNLPVVVVALLRAGIPELDIGKRLLNWYIVLYMIVYCCGLINCTANIFVYYNVSTKYRREFDTLFCRGKFRKDK